MLAQFWVGKFGPRILLRTPGHIHAYWNLVLDRHCQERRAVDFEIGERGWNCPRDVSLATLCFQFERNLLVVGGLASELNLQIGVDGRRYSGRFWQARANGDYGKLCTAGYLNHVEVTVVVPRIERLDGYRDQEIALSRVANSLPSRRGAHSFTLVQGVGHMVSESALLQNPLAICGRS
jgi:hypothetical protein